MKGHLRHLQPLFRNYAHQRSYLRAQVKGLSAGVDTTHSLLIDNVGGLSDMEYVYTRSNTVQKQQLVRVVFDNGLYYENGSYRTPYLIPQLAHNELIMMEKQVLFIEKKKDFFAKIPLGGAEGSSIEHLLALFDFLSKLKLGEIINRIPLIS